MEDAVVIAVFVGGRRASAGVCDASRLLYVDKLSFFERIGIDDWASS